MKTHEVTHYGQPYFERLPNEKGVHRLKHNTCQLLDFTLVNLAAGETYEFETGEREYGIDVFTGLVDVRIGNASFENLGGRKSVFEELPSGAYAGCRQKVIITAKTQAELGIASTPSTTPIEPYIVQPTAVDKGSWGEGNTLRHYRYLINNKNPSERLWFAEVVVRDGRWATYPPHKHEDVPGDLFQEEMYFYKVEPEHGFGFCGQFGGLVESDYAFLIRNHTIHKMPHGYHTVTAAPGYQVFYLALYAGRDKQHRPSPHPDHVNFKDNKMPDPLI
jgi:5-deoxy-glucuronate isomerase